MKLLIILCLLSTNAIGQYLSNTQVKIVFDLKSQKVHFTTGVIDGKEFIKTHISGSEYTFIFDEKSICRKEVITTLSDKATLNMIMDLDEKHYIQLSHNSFIHEQDYGDVEVVITESTFTFTY